MFQDSLLEFEVVGLGEMVGNASVKDENCPFSQDLRIMKHYCTSCAVGMFFGPTICVWSD